ncbi:nitrite reductase large subunit NirB [Shewanella gelidii]|uniref:Nitrite reductase large subunit n=1 Tax=Shewanella gelidii TaxID=1642821 RepID=A0A917JXB2_9GAMM|nr:nitrite reductase large subunit NirB [Shewanella gelidii]MCL1099371.1 nitrite reductase large subunit NirB [Shewanella gelidii]GGI91275.1 nitrite reductase large subunit [Shewanella gelidii]
MKTVKVLVVGNGMVGHKFIDTMLEKSELQKSILEPGEALSTQFKLQTFSEESRLAYDRVQLSGYFNGQTAEDLALTDADYYKQRGVDFTLADKVVAIDTKQQQVTTQNGSRVTYDKLVLATGSYPFVPPIPGNDQPHCLVYRTIDDLEAIEASSKQSQVGVVIGGGLLGLEAANALQNLGLQTHVVEFAPRLMAVQLDDGGASLLRRKITDLGVTVHTEKATTEIVAGTTHRYRLNFADGSFLETDMLVFSAGIRPQDELAKQANIDIGERGGIVIDDRCRTSAENVYAIGECALWENKIFGLVAPGYAMANTAASDLFEQEKPFLGADMSTKLKLLGVDVASIGDAHGATEGSQSYTYSDDVEQVYKRIIVSADNKKLLGAVLVGDASAYGTLLQLMLNDMDLPNHPSTLILPAFEGEEAADVGVAALPETAQICSCFDVTKANLIQAVSDGATDMGAIKSMTKASTGCGGCGALVKQVMDAELEALGHTIDNSICEHFSYSRSELADIIRVKKIKTFASLLAEHGQGLGCDVCKPTVSNILASFWNEYVLQDEHVGLQDTNDVYLGNMQKDGTYSVVPRIAGGEVTPDKLIVLGEVAKEFDLYTKITGGQRIDLFGAQLHELPLIWRKLVDAGFETGHAYGKSVRTVKSCVGNSWCRYGVNDSLGFAIDIENRYKGLRSPHKLKFAVSGCTRECAEAQSKDVGIIATEKGWNLYVGGNGGMRPRHADLFASDLDDETLVKYIDRFLMFYIRTAERLQRTSVWLESLEGGLAYLKQVVIEDKLGIADELESEMARSIAQYQCEWKTTIESPEKLKRFQHFINSQQPDDQLAYDVVRQQRLPKTTDNRINVVELVE